MANRVGHLPPPASVLERQALLNTGRKTPFILMPRPDLQRVLARIAQTHLTPKGVGKADIRVILRDKAFLPIQRAGLTNKQFRRELNEYHQALKLLTADPWPALKHLLVTHKAGCYTCDQPLKNSTITLEHLIPQFHLPPQLY